MYIYSAFVLCFTSHLHGLDADQLDRGKTVSLQDYNKQKWLTFKHNAQNMPLVASECTRAQNEVRTRRHMVICTAWCHLGVLGAKYTHSRWFCDETVIQLHTSKVKHIVQKAVSFMRGLCSARIGAQTTALTLGQDFAYITPSFLLAGWKSC